MPLVLQCDGCRKEARELGEFKDIGVITVRSYCAACVPLAEQFLAERDAVHDAAAKVWGGYTTLIDEFRAVHVDFLLPDVPEEDPPPLAAGGNGQEDGG